MSTVPPPPPGYIPPAPGIPPPAAGPRGCWRTGLIGCGIAGLVVMLCIVAAVLYMRRNPQVITDWLMTQVDAHLAPDVTDQEKKDLHDAYAAYRAKLRNGTASPEGLQRVQRTFMSGSNNEISREQVRDLTDGFRRAAGLPSLPRPAGEPASGATPSATTPSPAAIPSPRSP